MDLKEKVAVITGGSGGMGRGICRILADYGAHVVVADVNEAGALKAADDLIREGKSAMACTVDVTSKTSVDKMLASVVSRFQQIDILVNNAGVVGAPGFQDSMVSREVDWDVTYQVNVKGVVLPSMATAEYMKARRSGRIINIASGAGRVGRPQHPHYSASKAAVINWTQAQAMVLGPYDVTVNAVCPGIIWTPMMETVAIRAQKERPELKDMSPKEIFETVFKERNLLGRPQTAEDIGYAVAFFSSEAARNITGQALNVDGGRQMN